MQEIKNLLTLDQAHAGFERVVDGVDLTLISEVRGHSLWQLLEHIRLAQADLLRYMTDPDYSHDLEWPDDYWPSEEASAEEWRRSVEQFREDHEKIVAIVDKGDLQQATPSNPEHSILRDLLVLADHNAYHLGQMALIRKMLGDWG